MSQVWFLELSCGSQTWNRVLQMADKPEKPPSGQEVGRSGHPYAGGPSMATRASTPDPLHQKGHKGLLPRGSGSNPSPAVPGAVPRRQRSPTSRMGRLGAARGYLPLTSGVGQRAKAH